MAVRNDEYIELDEHRAMVTLPENAVEINIEAKIYDGGKIKHVARTMSMQDIREAFHKADSGYIDEDDRFTITDAGKQYLEELRYCLGERDCVGEETEPSCNDEEA